MRGCREGRDGTIKTPPVQFISALTAAGASPVRKAGPAAGGCQVGRQGFCPMMDSASPAFLGG